MIILYGLGGYILATYCIGAAVFLWDSRNEGVHVQTWGRFYFTLSPILVPLVIYVWVTDR